ncbi:MAG TPA: hypothetical protein VGL74_01265 [Terriglobales bacterium]|jgi:hypothetical protein
MLVEHLGQEVEIDAKQAAFENAVISALRKHGPMRQRDLWYRAAGCRVGRDIFEQVIDSLVRRQVIRRETTNRANSFILRMRKTTRSQQPAPLEIGQ